MKEGQRGFLRRLNPKELIDRVPRPCRVCNIFYTPHSKPHKNEDFSGTCSTCDIEIYGSALYIKSTEEGIEFGEVGMLFEPFLIDDTKNDQSAHVRLPDGKKSRMLFIGKETIEKRNVGLNGEKQQYARVKLILIEQDCALVQIRNSFYGEEGQTVAVDRRKIVQIN